MLTFKDVLKILLPVSWGPPFKKEKTVEKKPAQLGEITIDSDRLSIWKTTYDENGRLAIYLMDEMGALYSKLSINLARDEVIEGSWDIEPNEFFVRQGSWDEYMHAILLSTGLFQSTGKTIVYGNRARGNVWRLCK